MQDSNNSSTTVPSNVPNHANNQQIESDAEKKITEEVFRQYCRDYYKVAKKLKEFFAIHPAPKPAASMFGGVSPDDIAVSRLNALANSAVVNGDETSYEVDVKSIEKDKFLVLLSELQKAGVQKKLYDLAKRNDSHRMVTEIIGYCSPATQTQQRYKELARALNQRKAQNELLKSSEKKAYELESQNAEQLRELQELRRLANLPSVSQKDQEFEMKYQHLKSEYEEKIKQQKAQEQKIQDELDRTRMSEQTFRALSESRAGELEALRAASRAESRHGAQSQLSHHRPDEKKAMTQSGLQIEAVKQWIGHFAGIYTFLNEAISKHPNLALLIDQLQATLIFNYNFTGPSSKMVEEIESKSFDNVVAKTLHFFEPDSKNVDRSDDEKQLCKGLCAVIKPSYKLPKLRTADHRNNFFGAVRAAIDLGEVRFSDKSRALQWLETCKDDLTVAPLFR